MISVIKAIKARKPIFVACWPGMGEVAYRAGLFLKENLHFEEFAYFDTRDYITPQGVVVKEGLIELPSINAGIFSFYKEKNKEIILFLSEAQPPFEKAYSYALQIIEFIKNFSVKEVFSFASIPQPIEHTQEPNVWITSTSQQMLSKFLKYKVKILNEGHISGLNGLIIGVAKEKNMEGCCLLGEIPLYTLQIENPWASKKILEIFLDYMNIDLNLSPFDERQLFINEQIERILQVIKGEAPSSDSPISEKDIEHIKKDLVSMTKLPESVRKKIEELFKKAQKDISVAMELKRELDRWGVYQEYEDRFLDLFRKKKPPKDH